jgi:protein lin-54
MAVARQREGEADGAE